MRVSVPTAEAVAGGLADEVRAIEARPLAGFFARHGELTRLSPLVRRMLANNPGPFTFTGTCTEADMQGFLKETYAIKKITNEYSN